MSLNKHTIRPFIKNSFKNTQISEDEMPNVDIDTHDNFCFLLFLNFDFMSVSALTRSLCGVFTMFNYLTKYRRGETKTNIIYENAWVIYVYLYSDTPKMCASEKVNLSSSSPTHIKIDHKTLFPRERWL